MKETKFTAGPWVVSDREGHAREGIRPVITAPGVDRIAVVSASNGTEAMRANAHLISAAPELLAYAQAEENAHTLWQLGEDCYAKKFPIADYWAAVDRLFPEIAAKCPEPTEEAARDWFEKDFTTTLDARDKLYGSDADISGDEGSFCHLLHVHLMALRSAALAKALGRAS